MSTAVDERDLTDEQPETADEPDPENGDELEQPETEPTPDPPEPEARSEADIEKAVEKLEREEKRHTSRLSEIMGEDALALVPCELCEPSMLGFHWPVEMLRDDDPRKGVLVLLQGDGEAKLEHPGRYAMCATCNGWGKVLTGSREANNATKVCPDSRCNGTGYIDNGNQQGQGTAPNGHVEAPAATFASTVSALDFMNRPQGHPNFGKLPAYLTPDEQAIDVRDGFAVN